MEKLPMESIDKLFNCLSTWYGQRWSKQFDRWMPLDFAKTLWQSALQGCSHDEVRSTLVLLKQAAKSPFAIPPDYMEFYRYAKGQSRPFLDEVARSKISGRGDREVAKRALDEINAKIRYKQVG